MGSEMVEGDSQFTTCVVADGQQTHLSFKAKHVRRTTPPHLWFQMIPLFSPSLVLIREREREKRTYTIRAEWRLASGGRLPALR